MNETCYARIKFNQTLISALNTENKKTKKRIINSSVSFAILT